MPAPRRQRNASLKEAVEDGVERSWRRVKQAMPFAWTKYGGMILRP